MTIEPLPEEPRQTPPHGAVLRCSSLPRIRKCLASRIAPDIIIDDDSEPARLGRAVHKIAERLMGGETLTPAMIDAVAEEYRIEGADELRFLAYAAKDMIDELRPTIGWMVMIEGDMLSPFGPEYDLSGHPDVVCESRDLDLVVWDYKSGRRESDYYDQLMGYAFEALHQWPNYERVKMVTLWLRTRVREVVTKTRDEVMAWAEAFWKRLEEDNAKPTPTYSPSPDTCKFCPLRGDCEAYAVRMRQSAMQIVKSVQLGTAITLGDLVQHYGDLQDVEAACKNYRATLRAELEGKPPMDIGNGFEMLITETKTPQYPLTRELATWLTNRLALEPGELFDALSLALDMPKKVIEKLAGDRAPKGEKGKFKKEIIEALADTGLVRVKEGTKITTRKKGTEDGESADS